jgi:hypothetical protein
MSPPPPPYAPPPYMPPQHAVITDIRIPFWRLVGIFIKWTFAAIPATIIVVLIFVIIAFIVGIILAAFGITPPRPPLGGVLP